MGKKPKNVTPDAKLFQQLLPLELRKGELRKLEIVRATLQCLAELGYENTNFETVGKYCKMQRPHVAYHFKKKEQFIETAIRYAYSMGQEVVIDHLVSAPDNGKLEAYIDGTFLWLESHPGYGPAVMLLAYLSSRSENFRAISTEYKRVGAERVLSLLKSSMLLKNFPEQKHTQIANTIHVFIAGRVLQRLTCEPQTSSLAYRKETYEQVLEILRSSR